MLTSSSSATPLARLQPTLYLRLEGLATLSVAVLGYRHLHAAGALGWTLFALLFLLPDIAMLGYLRGPAVGALAYNLAHFEFAPIALLIVAYATGNTTMASVALVWMAHIGFDRAAGYGLKYARTFFDTHLGRIGRNAAAQDATTA